MPSLCLPFVCLPVCADWSTIDATLKDLETRDVLLGELDDCLRFMATSECVKTYQQQCDDLFSNEEELNAGAMPLEDENAPPLLGGTPVWHLKNYRNLSYTQDEFPSNFPDAASLLTGE